jgi:hypothetical protein
MKFLLLTFIFIPFLVMGQTVTSKSITCWYGTVNRDKGTVSWEERDNCNDYTFKFKSKKLIIINQKRQKFKIIKYLGEEVNKEYKKLTWTALDMLNSDICSIVIVYFHELDIQHLYIEYADQSYCFQLIDEK